MNIERIQLFAQLPNRGAVPMQQRRRRVIAFGAGMFFGGELAGGSAANAQSGGPPARIGLILPSSAAANATRLAAFQQGMRENDLIEGKHYVLDVVYAEGHYERFPALAKELLQRSPAVIMVGTIASVRAAQLATRTVPIVMVGTNDPVGSGMVASFARPGGNTTGLSTQIEDTTSKYVEFVREALPHAKRIVLLSNPGNPSHKQLGEQVRTTALKFGIETRTIEAATPAALDAAFVAIAKQESDALVVLNDAMLNVESQRISAFALKNRIASFGPDVQFVEVGGLLSYGPSILYMFRRSASFVKKILNGARPADLPVEQPTTFELALNLKTANALRVKIPPSIQLRADRVIE